MLATNYQLDRVKTKNVCNNMEQARSPILKVVVVVVVVIVVV